MRVWKNALLNGARCKLVFIPIILFSLVFTEQAVFADGDISVSISPISATMEVIPESFASTSQTLTISTTSLAGYTVSLSPSGSSNALINQSDSNFTIPTFTLPGGSSSLPAGSTGYGYGYSTDSGLNYYPIPTPGLSQQIFETNSPGENEHTLTFGALVSAEKPQGTYSGTITIEIVAKLLPCPPEKICYYGNHDDGTGTMPDQSATSNTETTLISPNFSRPSYGFVSWNTAIDGTGTDYGPNEIITTGDLSLEGLQLYAKWTPSTGNLQNWHGCSDLSVGDVTALTDARDSNTYAVGKFADGQCWMMENLRLDLSDPDLEISGLNTNRPTATFVSAINNNHPASTNSFCTTNNSACADQVLHNTNNTNRSLTASYDTNDSPSSWYSYGNYYNWYTITAGNGTYSMSTAGTEVNGDICPASWRLPSGYGNVGDLSKLDVAMGGSGRNQASGTAAGLVGTARWRKYPLNFLFGGEQKGDAMSNRAISSSYATINVASAERTTNLWIKTDGVYMNSNNTLKVRGQTVRCIFNEGYHVNGNIHYDANGGTGTMADENDVDFNTALAANNEFTKSHAAFSNWNTQPDGGGVTVSEGGMVVGAAEHMSVAEGGTLTLYAIWRSQYSLTYDGNSADAGSMSSASASGIEIGKTSLVASNFSRAGYGFVGWSLDASAATKLANGDPVTIYGPNETISVDNAFVSHADANNQITLYAVWLPEDTNYTLQSFSATECSAMSIGDVTALKDIRDNNTYAVAKLEDGNCWTIENLRLDPSTTAFDNSNTNYPTAAFVASAPSSVTANTLCNNNNSACIDSIEYNSNSINRSYTPSSSSSDPNRSWYSYGIMYNWYTASAGNGDYAMTSGNVAGDICPAGWRLPTGGTTGEYVTLNDLANNGSLTTDAGLVKFPDNFIYSGDYNHDKAGGRGSYGRFWSATPNGNNNAYRLGVVHSGATPASYWNKWDAFAVRCIVKP